MYEELWPPLAAYRLLLDDLGLVDLTMQPEHLDLVPGGAHHVILRTQTK